MTLWRRLCIQHTSQHKWDQHVWRTQRWTVWLDQGEMGESNGWWDRVRYGPCRRWKEFGVYPKCKHWRVLNRLNLYHFNSTKVPSFHIDLYLYHLLVIFNFNREKHLKSQIVKLVIHLSCLSHNLYRVLQNFANHHFTYKGCWSL